MFEIHEALATMSAAIAKGLGFNPEKVSFQGGSWPPETMSSSWSTWLSHSGYPVTDIGENQWTSWHCGPVCQEWSGNSNVCSERVRS